MARQIELFFLFSLPCCDEDRQYVSFPFLFRIYPDNDAMKDVGEDDLVLDVPPLFRHRDAVMSFSSRTDFFFPPTAGPRSGPFLYSCHNRLLPPSFFVPLSGVGRLRPPFPFFPDLWTRGSRDLLFFLEDEGIPTPRLFSPFLFPA